MERPEPMLDNSVDSQKAMALVFDCHHLCNLLRYAISLGGITIVSIPFLQLPETAFQTEAIQMVTSSTETRQLLAVASRLT